MPLTSQFSVRNIQKDVKSCYKSSEHCSITKNCVFEGGLKLMLGTVCVRACVYMYVYEFTWMCMHAGYMYMYI